MSKFMYHLRGLTRKLPIRPSFRKVGAKAENVLQNVPLAHDIHPCKAIFSSVQV